MNLTVRVLAGADVTPDSDATLDAAHAAIAQRASAWTTPVCVGSEALDDGSQLLTYATDASPKADPSIVTTRKAAPALLPPTIT